MLTAYFYIDQPIAIHFRYRNPTQNSCSGEVSDFPPLLTEVGELEHILEKDAIAADSKIVSLIFSKQRAFRGSRLLKNSPIKPSMV